MQRNRTSWATLAACCGVLAASFAGCAGRDRATPGAARIYPESLPRAGTLDIQVVRRGTEVTMTNTTATAVGPSTIWLNMQWSRDIDGFASGQTLSLDLDEFVNEHGERFRAGGFFASERPDTIALAQIERTRADGTHELVGLVTVRGAAE